uniref:Phosphoribulokinase/uridine kinase domain-containing protein n=1 Tax=Ornithorhynchus anatinus TaxID=9258 RepID=A0A6I8NPR7_ORNAN
MAGDSEQSLASPQEPPGGEPFLIGVSGGTASGKAWLLCQAAIKSRPNCLSFHPQGFRPSCRSRWTSLQGRAAEPGEDVGGSLPPLWISFLGGPRGGGGLDAS